MQKIMDTLKSLDKNYIYNYKEVEKILDEIKGFDIIDYEIIEGSLLDSYLIYLSDLNNDYQYCLFVETYLNCWSSGLKLVFIKDDEELKNNYEWIVNDIEKQYND